MELSCQKLIEELTEEIVWQWKLSSLAEYDFFSVIVDCNGVVMPEVVVSWQWTPASLAEINVVWLMG
ncbi:unnamed protein product [Sphenostylis stenocarpa]|uniref:Uncharacterized protein n=1 Tax=Sphenostylis stenocarpa TaxID=92480 RepID=A0AA86TRK5_9FABA|nr:unnamed protein product [Sphenostylis stenocarpa]